MARWAGPGNTQKANPERGELGCTIAAAGRQHRQQQQPRQPQQQQQQLPVQNNINIQYKNIATTTATGCNKLQQLFAAHCEKFIRHQCCKISFSCSFNILLQLAQKSTCCLRHVGHAYAAYKSPPTGSAPAPLPLHLAPFIKRD